MAPYTPPTTGVGSVASAVAANLFDELGYLPFRPRSGTGTKRKRTDGGGGAPFSDERYAMYDITQDYPPLTYPKPAVIDIPALKSLLLDASKEAAELAKIEGDQKANKQTKIVAKSALTTYKLIEMIVEKAIVPWAESNNSRAPAFIQQSPPPIPEKTRNLKKALEQAEKTAIIFNSNLGPAPMGNRAALACSLTAGLRNAAVEKAKDPEEAAEAVRLAVDALSCATKIDFLGQASRRPAPKLATDNDGNETLVEAPFCTMPVLLEFEDRNVRQHFERTIREKCGVWPSMSLPAGIRNVQKALHANLKAAYPDMIIMLKADSESLSFSAMVKKDGDRHWNTLLDKFPIDPDCLVLGTDPATTAADGAGGAVGGANSQS